MFYLYNTIDNLIHDGQTQTDALNKQLIPINFNEMIREI